jgi:hypothetical protein
VELALVIVVRNLKTSVIFSQICVVMFCVASLGNSSPSFIGVVDGWVVDGWFAAVSWEIIPFIAN